MNLLGAIAMPQFVATKIECAATFDDCLDVVGLKRHHSANGSLAQIALSFRQVHRFPA